MARAIYIQDQNERGAPVLRGLFIALLLLVLIASLVTGYIIHRRSVQAQNVRVQFDQALAEDRFADAVSLYRQTREQALSDSPFDRNQALFKAAQAYMEDQAGVSLDLIEHKLRQGIALSSRDIDLAGSLAELTSARLITIIRSLCRAYLFADLERAAVDLAFAQLGELANISQGIGGLAGELDTMDEVRQDVAAANQALQDGQYWQAWSLYERVLDHDGLGVFAREQVLLQSEQCRSDMYRPLLQAALELISGGRYVSAQKELLALQTVFPDDPDIGQALETCLPFVPSEWITYQGPVEFLTIKPLIVDPARAFDGDAYAAAAFDSMLTVGEFEALISELHASQYILVDADRLYDREGRPQSLQLPPGRKPVVLVIEGLNYYITRRETGNAWNLVLDEGGEVAAEYPDGQGRMIVDRRGEAIGILDLYVAANPDFSLDGAKGTISLTGYECVFGMITDPDQLDDRNKALQDHGQAPLSLSEAQIAENRSQAAAIVARLRETGWLFASSTYGFIDARSQPLERIRSDTEKWLAQVGSLTGPVSMLHYPNGAFIPGSDDRARYLIDQGFILFGGIGATPYQYAGDRYLYVDKLPVNGYTLRNPGQFQLDRLIDASRVYDLAGRNP